ncbi:MAG: NAD(P)-dependent oxidoreductase, partial [Gammaproteobacteria bacterium]|nr:NAD(P)-dependent oxidoreductase [Gammaproteobacteria bacterium]
GASKLAGERAVTAACEKYIILRTAWVFSEYGSNFVKTMVRLAKERDELSVVADQYGCPTYAGDLAKAILRVCEQHEQGKMQAWGVYHYCGDTPTSWHGFARAIFTKAELLGVIEKRPQLKAISSDQYQTPAKRPEYSVMKETSLASYGVISSDWLSALDFIFKDCRCEPDQ